MKFTHRQRILVGMDRIPWFEFRELMLGAYTECSCGSTLTEQVALRKHWQDGHFDNPIYKYIELEGK